MFKLSSLRRFTASGKFIPEIDGLRFVAIIPVVFCHLFASIAAKNPGNGNFFDATADFFIRGKFGVQLFFVISGLILGIPFCLKRMRKENNLNLKSYYLRRLTRIEPPYFLVMIVLFFASVYIAHSLEFNLALKSLVSSLLYSHNFVFGRHVYPLLTTVAWSLEIEIQFYLLVPLISAIFLIGDIRLRRGLMVAIIIIFSVLADIAQLPFISLYDFIQYFMIGFLLADIYCRKDKIAPFKISPVFGYLALVCMWLYDTEDTFGIWVPVWHLLQIGFLFTFFYTALFMRGFSWLKKEFIVVVGGMCYSIYLLHYPIISFLGGFTRFLGTGNTNLDNFIIAFLIFITVLAVSAVFYLLIERPCMKKDWYKNLLPRRKKLGLEKPL